MSETSSKTAEAHLYAIEENYPRQLTPAEIKQIRTETYNEAWKVMTGIDLTEHEARLVEETDSVFIEMEQDPSSAPPAEPIIQTRKRSPQEIYEFHRQMRRQLTVSLRYIEELLAIDEQLCGNRDRGTTGIALPVRRIRQHGKHHAVIITRNTWGSTPVEEDTELQERLKAKCTQPDAEGMLRLDEEAYRKALRQYQRDHTNADLPVLGEDDRVHIFDAEGKHIGNATVREVTGDTVRLYCHTPMRLNTHCTLRKRSNRLALETYQVSVHAYCQKLECTHQMTNREGKLYWKQEAEEETNPPVREDWVSDDRYQYSAGNPALLTIPEQFFLGEEWDTDRRQALTCSIACQNTFEQEDIPRKILDDDEQCRAAALAAMGHPCTLIQGPPGTGKTEVASLLTRHFQKQGLKTLILSHSNRGLDVLLLAAREKGVDLHRGGTEEGVCARNLRDAFIRKGMRYPRRAEFLELVFNKKAFDKAQAAYDPASGEQAPVHADFTSMKLSEERWAAAWETFEEQKLALVAKLKQEKGLTVGVTLNSLITDEIIQALDFDVVIVDEASKGFLYEFLPALKKAGKQIIAIFDHKQLGNIAIPPNIKNHLEDAKSECAGNPAAIGKKEVDIFEGGPLKWMAEQSITPQIMLRTDRRSLKDLVRVVSFGAYDGKLKAGRKDHDNPDNGGSLLWVDTSGRPDRGEVSAGVSRINPLEARLVARRLMDEFERGELSQESFGVIAMYRAQANQILRKARKTHPKRSGSREEFLEALKGNVATVDSFQGSERDTIHLTTTRSNESGTVGFLDDVRRTNVAASRARNKLVVYGDPKTLIENNPDPASAAYFRVLYDICAQRGEIISAFSTLPGQVRPEEQKKQARNARWKRKRRAKQHTEKDHAFGE
ncbi:MAG: AAA domain-containing protein [Candidatus Peribacteraceae bacterium]|nr:AAA domain-containing protein [Candidatus Peribacteraceae bacterium]